MFTLISFGQEHPKNGIYDFKFFDTEYHKFCGKCKAVIKGDSIKVIAIEDCHQAPNTVIAEGVLRQERDNKERWIIIEDKKYLTDDSDIISSINFQKKIFYSY